MTETMDQIFVILKHWLVGHVPVQAQPIVSATLSIVAIIVVFASLFALTTIMERKGLGRFQNRYGPNRVGPFGLLQPLADGSLVNRFAELRHQNLKCTAPPLPWLILLLPSS